MEKERKLVANLIHITEEAIARTSSFVSPKKLRIANVATFVEKERKMVTFAMTAGWRTSK